ncbi:hypothetical protein KC976_02310 [Candidatus Saccharibacteria bacterium]|jgi:hypothetical protein|nr:hypothetical protein [Candidatus Saccharibacteria bacterium]HPG37172.1 hypothetical protein [Candidatus Saccharibacteria bacterium]
MIINTSPRTTPEDTTLPRSAAQAKFYASDGFIVARDALQAMVDSPLYNTDSAYYRSGSSLGFCERHLEHLSRHPELSLPGYLSNLRLMTRGR